MTTTRRISDEFADHLNTLNDYINLRDQLIEHGERATVASSIIGWLLDLKYQTKAPAPERKMRIRWEQALEKCTLPDGGPGRRRGRNLGAATEVLSLSELADIARLTKEHLRVTGQVVLFGQPDHLGRTPIIPGASDYVGLVAA